MISIGKYSWGIIGIVCLAVLLRLIFLYQWTASDFAECPILDQCEFLDQAGLVAAAGFEGLGIPWRPPLYPLLLGWVFRLTSGSWLAAWVLQCLVSGLCAGLVYLIAKRLASAAAAVAAAALYAGHWIMIFSSVLFLNTILFTFLVLLTLWLLIAAGDDWRRLALAGLAGGLAALTRAEIVPCLAAWALWIFLRGGKSPRVRAGWGLLFVGAAALAISPITIRNYQLTKSFIPISAIGGYNLFVGNNAQSDGKTVWASEKALDQLKVAPDLPPLENQRRYTGAVLDFVKSEPLSFLKLLAKKAYYLANAHEISDNVDIYYSISATSLLLAVLACVSFGLLLPLAVVGLIFGRYERRGAAPVLIFLAVGAGTLLFFFINSRFRAPLLPCLGIFAVLGVETLWRERRELVKRPARLTVFAVCLLLSNSRLFGVTDPRDTLELNLRQAHAFYFKQKFNSCRQLLAHILAVAPESALARSLAAKLPPKDVGH